MKTRKFLRLAEWAAVFALVCLFSLPVTGRICRAENNMYDVKVSKNYLALRSGKEFSRSNEIGELYNGDSVRVEDTSDPTYWYVYSPKHDKYGYVNKDYLVAQESSGTETWEVSVSKGYLALRSAKGYDEDNEIGELYTGDTVQVENKDDSTYWYVYSPKLDKYGYVNRDYLIRSSGTDTEKTAQKKSASSGKTGGITITTEETLGGFGAVSYSDSSAYLPSPDAWFHDQLARNEEGPSNHGGRFVSFTFDLESKEAAYDYARLLKDSRFQLSLGYEQESDYTSSGTPMLSHTFRFYYQGSGTVGTTDPYTVDEVEPGAVQILLNEYYDEGRVGMSIYYADGFEFIDDGDRSEIDSFTDYSGKSSSGGGSSSSSSGSSGISISTSDRRDCPDCVDGWTDCKDCGGTGYVTRYTSTPQYGGSSIFGGSHRETHKCPQANCHNGRVSCKRCHGRGWLD